MGNLGDHLKGKKIEEEGIDPNTPEMPEDIDPTLEEEEVQIMKKGRTNLADAVAEASEFLTKVHTMDFKKLTKGGVTTIMNKAGDHIANLIKLAPIMDAEGNVIVKDKNDHSLFSYFYELDNIYGRLWRLPYHLSGYEGHWKKGKSTFKRDVRNTFIKVRVEEKDKKKQKKELSNTTIIPKTGGGTWELKNGVHLLHFAKFSDVMFGATMGKLRATEAYNANLKRKRDAILEKMSVRDALKEGWSGTKTKGGGLKKTLSMRIKRLLAD